MEASVSLTSPAFCNGAHRDRRAHQCQSTIPPLALPLLGPTSRSPSLWYS